MEFGWRLQQRVNFLLSLLKRSTDFMRFQIFNSECTSHDSIQIDYAWNVNSLCRTKIGNRYISSGENSWSRAVTNIFACTFNTRTRVVIIPGNGDDRRGTQWGLRVTGNATRQSETGNSCNSTTHPDGEAVTAYSSTLFTFQSPRLPPDGNSTFLINHY